MHFRKTNGSNLTSKLVCVLAGLIFLQVGCASIFGWDIHAPGILSESFSQTVQPIHQRIALYLPQDLLTYQSKDRGGRTADPQTYHVGEALGPMLLEAFQAGFDEFVFMEVEPTAAVLKQYGIPYLVTIRIKSFKNRVTWGTHAITLTTETVVLDSDLKPLGRFKATGTSDARKVFAKKGGPQVNLNAALENNILAIIQYLQDSRTKGVWEGKSQP
ncbi:MAG: hypothetical protein HY351_00455 [Candidatus Omnitrophica bacterium]|nr:hypothetical protein [Candidatus Omnitrophota bacterium]